MSGPSTEDPRKGTANDAGGARAADDGGASASDDAPDGAPAQAASADEAETPPREAAALREAGDSPSAEPAREDGSGETPRDESAIHGKEHKKERRGSSLASATLKILAIVLIGFGLAIWLLPRIAPRLPDAWAEKLIPAQMAMDRRVAAVEARLADGVSAGTMAALEGQVAELTAGVRAAGRDAAEARAAAEAATIAAAEAGGGASSATRTAASLADRIMSLEARLAAVSERLDASSRTLAATSLEDDEADRSRHAAARAALESRIDPLEAWIVPADRPTDRDVAVFATRDDLRETRAALTADFEAALAAMPAGGELATRSEVDRVTKALEERVAALADRVDAAERRAAAAERSASEAGDRVGGAIRTAALDAAVASMMSRLEDGQAFAAALDQVADLSGADAPEALSAVATTGTATPQSLLRGLGAPFRNAVEIDIRERSDGGLFANASARIRSIFMGRPKGAREGESVEAVLSRAEAAIRADDLDAALVEIDGLPIPARTALGDWLTALRGRAAAMSAASEYVAALGADGG